MKKTSARVAMIGYQFMGRAHANAWRQAKHFAKPALTPELRVVCGRDAKAAEIAAETLGFAESDTSWQRVIQRDAKLVNKFTRHVSHRHDWMQSLYVVYWF